MGSHAVLKSLLILSRHTEICSPTVVAVHGEIMVRSLHGRHSVEPTAPLGQCTHCPTLHAVGTALVRSHAVLKSQLITHNTRAGSHVVIHAVQDQIDARAGGTASNQRLCWASAPVA